MSSLQDGKKTMEKKFICMYSFNLKKNDIKVPVIHDVIHQFSCIVADKRRETNIIK